jgi:hypothetical protein
MRYTYYIIINNMKNFAKRERRQRMATLRRSKVVLDAGGAKLHTRQPGTIGLYAQSSPYHSVVNIHLAMRNSTHATGSVVTQTLSRQNKPRGVKLHTRYGGSVVTLSLSRHSVVNTNLAVRNSAYGNPAL